MYVQFCSVLFCSVLFCSVLTLSGFCKQDLTRLFLVLGVPAEFTVYTKGAGVGEVEVTVKDDKTGRSVPVEVLDNKDGTTSVVYHPDKPGKYTITVNFNGKPIPKSPFKVNISLNNPAKVKAFGPGLEKSTVGEPAKFTIETKDAGEGGLGLTIEGPTETKIDCKDNGDGSCNVTYFPEEPGDHHINILFADKHIPGSPFKAKASYPVDASKGRLLWLSFCPNCMHCTGWLYQF